MSTAASALPIMSPRYHGRPRLPADVVRRPRLHASLEVDPGATITLLSAPAGSGKTTLLLSWIAAREHALPIAWIPARGDWGAPEFWAAMGDAVAAAEGLDRLEEPGETPLEALLRTLTRLTAPLALVVDNFNEVTSPAVLDPIGRLTEWAPEPLHLVLACRRDPDLPLHRLRLEGRLNEIRARELAFTLDETATFFHAAGLELPEESVTALHEHTEGWAAALRFAAISLRHHPDTRSFVLALTRTEQAVTDYLVREVLAAQEPELRDFLLRTSLCERIDGRLADAITGRSDGALVLETLERDNVFLELQPNGHSYRYHRLFAELLQAEAQRELGIELDAVHAAAAQELAAQGERLEALRHALACGDARRAAELVGSLWIELIGGGELALARSLLARVTGGRILDEPHLCLLAAWERLAAGDLAEAHSWLGAADEPGRGDDRELRLGRNLVGLLYARLVGDVEAIEEHLGRLAQPEVLAQTPHDGSGRRAIVLATRGVVALWSGNLRVAQTTLEAAVDTARRARLGAVERDATGQLALVCGLRGALKRSARLAHAVGGDTSSALLALALCELEWDDAPQARAQAERARALAAAAADRIGELVSRAVATLAVAGDAARADDVCVELAALDADGCGELPVLEPLLAALRCRLALAAGDLAPARGVVAAARPSPQRVVAAARLGLASADADAALTELALLPDSSDAPLSTAVEAAVLRSLAAELVGAEEDARSWVERALELAEPEAVRRPFLDVGPAMAAILRRTIRRGSSHRWLAGSLLAVLDGREAPEGHCARELLEPLSERETVVLRYLPTMMSNQEIAGELFVSVNTVKTHLKSIYRKLGASDRREAVRLARELRLIG